MLVLGAPARAVVFEVTTTLDAVDTAIDGVCAAAGGGCTLRAALQEANATAGPASDTINVPAGTYTLGLMGRFEDGGATGDLDVLAPVTITGAGAALTIIDGNQLDRVFDVLDSAGVVMITGLTIQNGNPGTGAVGGGIWNSAMLTVSSARVVNNTGRLTGGGIQNDNTLTLTDVVLSGNMTLGQGGGLYNTLTAQLTGVTLSGNSSEAAGGGIVNDDDLTLTNVTVSGNTAGTNGGGLRNNVTAVLRNVTLAGNGAAGGGGGLSRPGTTTLTNTIVANSTAGGDCQGAGTFTSGGANLASDLTCAFGGAGDLNGMDPVLGALGDNGGPTPTHALLAGSPAIDAGTSCPPPATDQRGTARPQDGDNDTVAVCDIGAVETTYPPPGSSSTTSTSTTSTTEPPTTVGQGLAGRKLALTDRVGRPARRRVQVLSRDRQLDLGEGNGSVDDPTLHGATLRVFAGGGAGFDATYALPSRGWSYVGAAGADKGYRYRDRNGSSGPIAQVVVRRGKLLKAGGAGAGLEQRLDTDPRPVTVVLTLGQKAYCLSFGGQVQFRAGKRFVGKRAPSPAFCPP